MSSTGRVVGLAALLVMPSILEAVGPHRLQCNLKELYVTQLDRCAGVGTALMQWSARFAIERGCGQLDWHVKATNAAGVRFYERHGARLVADRQSYRLEGDQLSSLAAPESNAAVAVDVSAAAIGSERMPGRRFDPPAAGGHHGL